MPRAATLVLGLLGPAIALSPPEGPCDILAAAGNPCVAAHSTVRALFARYAGPLYRVARPNNETADIGVLEAGGFADVAAHDKFCAAGDCVIKTIFDQSHCGGKCAAPAGNHLGQRISGGVVHKMVNASTHRITVRGGVGVYGMWFDPGHGYHKDSTVGVAKGNEPESICECQLQCSSVCSPPQEAARAAQTPS